MLKSYVILISMVFFVFGCNKNLTEEEKKELWSKAQTTGVGSNTNKQVDADVVKAGIKYVTGDITMNVGMVSGTAKDNIFAGTGTLEDSHDEVNASVTYAVASGVSAILGYTSVDQNDEGASDTTGGSSWYIGATMSF